MNCVVCDVFTDFHISYYDIYDEELTHEPYNEWCPMNTQLCKECNIPYYKHYLRTHDGLIQMECSYMRCNFCDRLKYEHNIHEYGAHCCFKKCGVCDNELYLKNHILNNCCSTKMMNGHKYEMFFKPNKDFKKCCDNFELKKVNKIPCLLIFQENDMIINIFKNIQVETFSGDILTTNVHKTCCVNFYKNLNGQSFKIVFNNEQKYMFKYTHNKLIFDRLLIIDFNSYDCTYISDLIDDKFCVLNISNEYERKYEEINNKILVNNEVKNELKNVLLKDIIDIIDSYLIIF